LFPSLSNHILNDESIIKEYQTLNKRKAKLLILKDKGFYMTDEQEDLEPQNYVEEDEF